MFLLSQIKGHDKIGSGHEVFTAALAQDSNFGTSVTNAGDFNGDLTIDILAGAPGIDSCFLIFLRPGPGVYSFSKIGENSGGFTMSPDTNFGWGVSKIEDFNEDGKDDLLIGAAEFVFIVLTNPDADSGMCVYYIYIYMHPSIHRFFSSYTLSFMFRSFYIRLSLSMSHLSFISEAVFISF